MRGRQEERDLDSQVSFILQCASVHNMYCVAMRLIEDCAKELLFDRRMCTVDVREGGLCEVAFWALSLAYVEIHDWCCQVGV
jgi:hypothetical protein